MSLQTLVFILRPSLLIPHAAVLVLAGVMILVAVPLAVAGFIVYRKVKEKQQAKRDHIEHLKELRRLRAHSWEFENPTRPNDIPEDYYPEHWDIMVDCVERGISPGEYWRYIK